jgi:signal peptidase I
MDTFKNSSDVSLKKLSLKEEIFEILDTIVFSIVTMMFVVTFFFPISIVDGESMLPTLRHKDRLILSSFMYNPKIGDIVVVTKPNYRGHKIIKRIIAMEGQTVDINPILGKVFVDGKEVNEPFINEPTQTIENIQFPLTVPANSVFVMGDNRNNSMDSRFSAIGTVDKKYLTGKVIFRIFPLDRLGVVK